MALIYRAELRPSKMEIMAQWLPAQTWFTGDAAGLEHIGAYRFDDPDGEVGIETHLVTVGGEVFQIPLTYRDAALEGAEEWLAGTMQHSVLGQRWVYDACGDPVYAAALAHAMLTGQGQAEQFVELDGGRETLAESVRVEICGPSLTEVPVTIAVHPVPGTTEATTKETGKLDLNVFRVIDLRGHLSEARTLTGWWVGLAQEVQLAKVAHGAWRETTPVSP